MLTYKMNVVSLDHNDSPLEVVWDEQRSLSIDPKTGVVTFSLPAGEESIYFQAGVGGIMHKFKACQLSVRYVCDDEDVEEGTF